MLGRVRLRRWVFKYHLSLIRAVHRVFEDLGCWCLGHIPCAMRHCFLVGTYIQILPDEGK